MARQKSLSKVIVITLTNNGKLVWLVYVVRWAVKERGNKMDSFNLEVSHCRLKEHSKPVGELMFEGKMRQVLSSLNNRIVTQYYVVDFGWEDLPKTRQVKLLSRFSIKTT